MAEQEWAEWFQEVRQRGFTRGEIIEYLLEHGHDLRIVDQYWPAEQAPAENPVERDHAIDQMQQQDLHENLSKTNYTDTVLTLFTSPSGYFRRSELETPGAPIFAGINLAIFLLLGLISHTALALLRNTSILSATTHILLTTLQYILAILLLTAYTLPLLKLLGGRISTKKTFGLILYSTPALLLAWIPFIGPLLSLTAFYILRNGIEEHTDLPPLRIRIILWPAILASLTWILLQAF